LNYEKHVTISTMTNTNEIVKHTGHLYNGGGIAANAFAPVLEHEHGLVLVVGNAGSGKTRLLNWLVDYERSEGRNRKILSLNEGINEIQNVDHFVIPTWNNQPQLQKQYANYSDWVGATALDTRDELLERIHDHGAGIIVVDEIRNAEVATIVIALARKGYLVIVGMSGQDATSAKENLANILEHSATFKEYCAGYEEISGYNESVVDTVLHEVLHISRLEGVTKSSSFLRNIIVESYKTI
jgi:GTPase SAR1 family protein